MRKCRSVIESIYEIIWIYYILERKYYEKLLRIRESNVTKVLSFSIYWKIHIIKNWTTFVHSQSLLLHHFIQNNATKYSWEKNKSARSTSATATEGKTDAVNTSNIVTRPQSRIKRPNSLDTYVNRTTIPLIVYLIWFLLQYSDGIQRILVLPAHLISYRAPGMCAVAFSGLKDHWYGHTGYGFFKIFMREQRWEFAFQL